MAPMLARNLLLAVALVTTAACNTALVSDEPDAGGRVDLGRTPDLGSPSEDGSAPRADGGDEPDGNVSVEGDGGVEDDADVAPDSGDDFPADGGTYSIDEDGGIDETPGIDDDPTVDGWADEQPAGFDDYSPESLDPAPRADDEMAVPTPIEEQDHEVRTATLPPPSRMEVPVDGKLLIRRTRIRTTAPGYDGMNQADIRYAIDWRDNRYREMAATVRPGWLRFPAGTASDAFDWETGHVRDGWRNDPRFPQELQDMFERAQILLRAKGGAKIADFLSFARHVNAGIIACVNTFTDNPESAKALARWFKSRGVNIIAWELGNEAHFLEQFYPNGAMYAQRVAPFAAAIRDIFPNAKISLAISFPKAGRGRDVDWDTAVGTAMRQCRNENRGNCANSVSVHAYPYTENNNFERSVEYLNHSLVSDTRAYVRWLNSINPNNTNIYVTEMNAGLGGPVVATMWGGIFAVEYAARMSALNDVKRVGLHILYSGQQNSGAIQSSNDQVEHVIGEQRAGRDVNFSSLQFNNYITAQGAAIRVANGVFSRARHVWATRVVNADRVTARHPDSNDTRQVYAVYAKTFVNGRSRTILITNKGGRAHRFSLFLDGRRLRGNFRVTTAAHQDGSIRNNFSQQNVWPEAGPQTDDVVIPAYSVVRVDF